MEEEGYADRNMDEALILNEKVKRKAPKDWDSVNVIKEWRKNR